MSNEDADLCSSTAGGAALPYMPLWIGDYLADTRHLTTVEHGAYLLLIFEYWRKGGLPSNDARLARIACMRESDWLKVKDTIAEFFADNWCHKRIDRELAKAREKSDAAKASAKARWGKSKSARPHTSGQSNAMRSHSESYADEMLSDSKSDPVSLPSVGMGAPRAPNRDQPHRRSRIGSDREPDEKDCQAAQNAGLVSPDEFLVEWAHFRDHHISKGTLSADWSAAWRTWLAIYRKGTFARNGATSAGRESSFTRATRELLQECECEDREDHHGILDLEPLPLDRTELIH